MNLNTNFYKEILDNLSYEVFVTDGNGIILYCNEAFSKNYCYNITQLIGQPVSKVAISIKKGKPIIPIALEARQEVSLFQETIHGKKLFLTAKPIFNNDNSIRMIVENAREVINIPNKLASKSVNVNLSSEKTQYLIDTYGKDFTMFSNMSIFENISKISNFDVTVLLLGESGTGKSTCANFIHSSSSRKDGPFVTVNCTTIPESLIESELFGYVKGAFTGASKDGKKGLVELANNGTLFLDEIGDLPLASQSKLLELIQEKQYLPVGGNTKKHTNIRIIAATNKNLKKMISEGKFREDLYYRINVIETTLPPLRDRKDDIPIISTLLLNKLNTKYNLHKTFSHDLMLEFTNYSWPGNIRQLEHVIEKLLITSEDDVITMFHVEKNLDYSKKDTFYVEKNVKFPTLKSQLESAERELIVAAYNEYQNSYKLAEVLGISQSQASRKIRKYILK